MKGRDFAGTGAVIRLLLRRDRIWLLIWVLLPLLVAQGQVSFYASLADWEGFVAETLASPLASAVLGPVVPLTTAGASIWRTAPQVVLVLSIASLLTVIRHTRADEAAGRAELMRGGVVGRHAPLAGALALTCVANLVAVLLVAVLFVGTGLPAAGSLLFVSTLAAAGWFFAGIGALSAQLREQPGGARGLGLSVVGLALLLNVFNNLGGSYTGWAWFSPLAWFRVTQPFAGDHFWPLLVFAAVFGALALVAGALSTRRDFGAGLLPTRSGRAEAAPGLRSPLALAWRLHKGGIIAWTAGLVYLAGALGAGAPSVADGVSSLMANLGTGDWTRQLGNQEAFMAIYIYIVALLVGVTVYAIATVLRLRGEEMESRAEPLLTQPVSRAHWMSSHLVVAFAGSAFLLLSTGLAAGLGWGLVAGDVGSVLPGTLAMSLSKIPSVWVMAGIATAAYGLLPRAAGVLSWGALASFIALELAWEMQLVGWAAMSLSPFSYVHYSIPISELPMLPLFGLTILAAGLVVVGLIGFGRRDVA